MLMLKSYLRSLLAAAVTGLATVLSTDADLTGRLFLIALGAACLPVMARWIDSSDPAFGIGKI